MVNGEFEASLIYMKVYVEKKGGREERKELGFRSVRAGIHFIIAVFRNRYIG